ncbi:hypothetical protein [Winogradskyella algicola]|uniref:hypothetical protein n=1 Tax=Winogradskyella algicola TaxID=2575815 RepID=UPI00110975DD|nr:hypothetical protein [Winogradskyella algicola]
MKKLLYILAITTFLGCNNERVLLLPEIENAEVTEVLDVSPVYIFYDETQPDSTLFNRKNLIGTTNWLVNVDRRLTLRQAIPHIQYLQNKRKKESMHKNEDAKNYFTCNDTSIKNLGFLEFTEVKYRFIKNHKKPYNILIDSSKHKSDNIYPKTTKWTLDFDIDSLVILDFKNDEFATLNFQNFDEFIQIYETDNFQLDLYFNKNLGFQNYISIKKKLKKLKNNNIIINSNEFIY